jgi:hypothetical protein
VFIDGYEFYEEFDNETQANIATAAFKVDFVFVTEKSWYYYDDGTSQRRLGKPGKNPKQEQLHGNVNAVNYKGKRGQEVKYRKWYGSKDRRSMRPLRGANCFQSSLQRNFANVDFNDIIGRYTDRSPVEIGAVLNATSLKDLAVCRANNYNVFESESPLRGCREYNEFQCDLNDYIIMNGTERCSVNAVSSDQNIILPVQYLHIIHSFRHICARVGLPFSIIACVYLNEVIIRALRTDLLLWSSLSFYVEGGS